MRTQGMKWRVGALALVGSLAIVGASHASRTGNDRLTIAESDCLDGSHENTCTYRALGKCLGHSSTYRIQDPCRWLGTAVAKIDIAGAADKTWHIENADRRSGESRYNKTGDVYCCDDLGLCDRSGNPAGS